MGRKFLRSVLISDVAAFGIALFVASTFVFGTPLFWSVQLEGDASIWPMIIMLTVGGGIGMAVSLASWRSTVPRPLYSRAVAFVSFSVLFTTVGLVLTRAYFSRPYILWFGAIWLSLTLLHRSIRRSRPWQENLAIVTHEKTLVEDLHDAPHATVVMVFDPQEQSPGVPVDEGVTLVVDLRAVLSESMAQFVSSASISGTNIRTLSNVYEEHTGRIPMMHLAEGWELSQPVRRASYAPVKRVLDVVVVGLSMILWLPLALVVGLVVRLDSPGPVLYSQPRVGRDGRRFTLTKFRTMVDDAEAEGPQFTAHEDPRITRTGRFLRLSRLDELPQLWAVLRGELSLIGPRPERPMFVDAFSREIPFYEARHLIRPGVTGWAQVNYGYADDQAETIEKLTYDLFYIKHSSFWLDLQIIGKSVWTVLTGFGAR
ncbi:MAG: exopolysaccharide biosynthesis polyprenyl glycosylphosphotransferase [Proteobacteria bacterium]|nr:exopolysaccharide biosynthesis polyprenyl glycosylphosphotransferase [Pseudomonadota bacterium]